MNRFATDSDTVLEKWFCGSRMLLSSHGENGKIAVVSLLYQERYQLSKKNGCELSDRAIYDKGQKTGSIRDRDSTTTTTYKFTTVQGLGDKGLLGALA